MAFRSHSLPRHHRPHHRETIDPSASRRLYVETHVSTPHAAKASLPPPHSTASDGHRGSLVMRGKVMGDRASGAGTKEDWRKQSQTPQHLPPKQQRHFFGTPRVVDVTKPSHSAMDSLTLSRSEESRNPASEPRPRGRAAIRSDHRSLSLDRHDDARSHISDGESYRSNFSSKMRQEMRRVEADLRSGSDGRQKGKKVQLDLDLPETLLRPHEQRGARNEEHRDGVDQGRHTEEHHRHLEHEMQELRSVQSGRRRGVEFYKVMERNKLLEEEVATKDSELRELTRRLSAMKDKDSEIAELKRRLTHAEDATEARLAKKHAEVLEEIEGEYKTALEETVAENEMLHRELRSTQVQVQEAIDEIVHDQTKEMRSLREENRLLRDENRALGRENKLLKNEVDNMNRERDIAGKDVELSRRMLDEVTDALEAAVIEKDSLRRERAVLQREWDAAESEKKEAQNRYAALQSSKEAEMREKETMKKQNEKMSEMLEKYQEEIGKLKESNAGLSGERDDLKEELIAVLETASVYQG